MSAHLPARIALARYAEVTCRERAKTLAMRTDLSFEERYAALVAWDCTRAQRVRVELEEARRDAEAIVIGVTP